VNPPCKLLLSSCLCCLLATAVQTQDGQSQAGLRHLSAPPPNVSRLSDTVFGFTLGGAI
jgi:hypothetical protein